MIKDGEGNGNPLQYSCLENPRDGGAWWAAVYGVAQSRTRLKQLSSSSSMIKDKWPCMELCCRSEYMRFRWYRAWLACQALLPKSVPLGWQDREGQSFLPAWDSEDCTCGWISIRNDTAKALSVCVDEVIAGNRSVARLFSGSVS